MLPIRLTKGFTAYVSPEDYDRVAALAPWCASVESRGTKVYAVKWVTLNGKRVKLRMHRVVMGMAPGFVDSRVVDHLNGDSLDNTRENLEIVDQAENMRRVPTWCRKREEPCL